MAHRISQLRIENYKSIVSESFEFSDFTPLVGYNNAGKSNILSSIKWLLRKSSLPKEAFNQVANPVAIEGTIEGIDAALLGNLTAPHRNSIQTYIQNGILKIKRIQGQPGDSATAIKLLVYNPAAADPADPWVSNPNGIDNAINALFPEPIHIGAMENSEEDVSKSKAGTTIGKLLAEIIQPIEDQYGAQVQAALDGLRDILDADGQNRAVELTQFDAAVNQKIGAFFPDINLKLHVPTPELKEVFTKGTIKIYEPHSPHGKEAGVLGHGAQRSIQMALIRHLAELKQVNQAHNTTTLLLIDEPELYLHPQAIEIVREALKILATQGYQVIFSTHSPIMITHADVENTVLIRKNAALGTHKMQTLKAAIPQVVVDAPSQMQLLFSLSNSSNILFSEKVILSEGQTEQSVLPMVIQKLTNKTLGLHRYALVKQGGVSSTRKSMSVLRVMGLPTKSIVDLDYAFKLATGDGFLQATDPDLVACRTHLAQIAAGKNITLGNDGWPAKSAVMTATEAITILAAEAAVEQNIINLHAKLAGQNIWIWKKGAIEQHLGLQGKSEQHWANFVSQLKTQNFDDVVADPVEVRACVAWLMA